MAGRGWEGADVVPAVSLGLAAIIGALVPLRFRRRGESHGVTMEESVFVALLLTMPLTLVPVIAVVANLLVHGARRAPLLKLIFNVGHVSVYAVAATLVFHGIGPGPSVLHPRTLVAAGAATAVLNVISALLFAELFRRLHGTRYRETIDGIGRLYAVTWIGNLSAGLLIGLLIEVEPAAALLATTLLIGLYLGYRGYAHALQDSDRMQRLQELTRALADVSAPSETFTAFMRATAGLFSASAAELVVRDGGRYLRVIVDADGSATATDLAHGPLAGWLLDGGSPIRVTGPGTGAGADHALGGHHDALAAPITLDGAVIGALVVYDRHGLEPWDDSDLTLLATLANEAAVAVRTVELIANLERESRTLRSIVSAASDGIVLVGADGTVVEWNPGMEAATGVSAAAALGRAWSDVLASDDGDVPPHVETAVRSVLAGQRVDAPVDLRRTRDGKKRWLRCSIAPVDSAGQRGAVIVARDVTRQLELEQLKSDFVATVSHELRTPLTPLRGFLVTFAERWSRLSDEHITLMVEGMSRQVDRLESLVADLLAVADLDRGGDRLAGAPVSIGPVVRSIVAGEDPDGQRIDVAVQGDVVAIADPQALRRIVTAVVGNALTHTGGAVAVSVHATDTEAVIAVRDRGPGIAPGDQPRVFERFGRLGDHLTRTQGPGLGLAIARSLAERLGGRLELQSAPATGSTFSVHLPLATPADTTVAAAG